MDVVVATAARWRRARRAAESVAARCVGVGVTGGAAAALVEGERLCRGAGELVVLTVGEMRNGRKPRERRRRLVSATEREMSAGCMMPRSVDGKREGDAGGDGGGNGEWERERRHDDEVVLCRERSVGAVDSVVYMRE